ncbi:hypothetical protein LSH36_299g03003 [Paralvinella palmiformis]|uniref:F5/8 type C domain-containing protein n=1 Tax=Paralvinella palmiformis TaxID=53620 RepID=A0AAD9N170_9ANNE|nr:hypothetical protein LSH36_299g03003 [Paralvinella palmiformis]
MDKAPDEASRFRTLNAIANIDICLMYCSEQRICNSIIYEGVVCYLCLTSNGSEPLMPRQTAVTVILKEWTYGKIIDGDLSTYWSTTTSSLGEWVRIEFTKLLEIHAVELWSKKNGPQGQCRELIFTFSNNVNEKKKRNCVANNPALICDRFDFDLIKTSFLLVICSEQCDPPGWYGHYEIAVYVRKY